MIKKSFMKKTLAAVALAAAVGVCGVAFAACGSGSSSSSGSGTTYLSEEIVSLAEYEDAGNEQPLNFTQGVGLFDFDTWITTGTKVNVDDDTGLPVGCYWQFSLNIGETMCDDIQEYTLTVHYHIETSDLYEEDGEAFYIFEGYAYEVDGGYHLYVPNYAESTIILSCSVETAGWPEANGDDVTELVGPNGGTLYYHYTNSDLQAAGYSVGFPFTGNLIQGLYETDVLVSGSDLSGFANVTENLSIVTDDYNQNTTTTTSTDTSTDTDDDDDSSASEISEDDAIVGTWTDGSTTLYLYSSHGNINVVFTVDGSSYYNAYEASQFEEYLGTAMTSTTTPTVDSDGVYTIYIYNVDVSALTADDEYPAEFDLLYTLTGTISDSVLTLSDGTNTYTLTYSE